MSADHIDLNVNAAQCMKTASHFGFERVHNVCTKTVTDVPWGSADWAAVGVAAVLAAFVLTLFGALAAMIVNDTIRCR